MVFHDIGNVRDVLKGDGPDVFVVDSAQTGNQVYKSQKKGRCVKTG